jgi:hypothetical protein
MKRFIGIISVFVLEFFLLPSFFPALAVVCPSGFTTLCDISLDKKPNLFGNIVQGLLVFAIVLSVIFLVWGGIRWIMSGGDKGKVEQARSTVIAAIVGLIISLLAFFIVNLVLSLFGISGGLGGLKIQPLI